MNAFYAMRVKGDVLGDDDAGGAGSEKALRAVVREVKTQPKFPFENVAGTMVGFRGPPYIATLNASGYHFHVLTADQTGGGHVLSFTVDHAVLEWMRIDVSEIGYPTDGKLQRLGPEEDQ